MTNQKEPRFPSTHMVAPVLAILLFTLSGIVQGQTVNTIHSFGCCFPGQKHDGITPYGNLVVGAQGILYGTTIQGGLIESAEGVVYGLRPSSNGSWTEGVLWQFGSAPFDGSQPTGGVVVGPNGSLYGTTSSGGKSGQGTVFELVPPAVQGGPWTETILHSFGGEDGSDPFSGVVVGQNGVLYGTTGFGGVLDNGGTVFQIVPPSVPGGAWTESVLYSFYASNPTGGLLIASDGALYGTTAYGGHSKKGTAFKLVPPQQPGGTWTEVIIHAFGNGQDGAEPWASLVLGQHGVLYGTTHSGGAFGLGTVFSLTPPAIKGDPFTEAVLHSFGSGNDGHEPAYAPLTVGPNGVLYGTTPSTALSGGIAFQLTPPAIPGGTWTETVLYAFGDSPISGLVLGSNGVYYGATVNGGTYNDGTVYSLIR